MKIVSRLLNILGLKRGIEPEQDDALSRVGKEAKALAARKGMDDTFHLYPSIFIEIAAEDLGIPLTNSQVRAIAREIVDGHISSQENPDPTQIRSN